jgi:RNA polymerase sigma-70 factor (ECF subfamily)
MADSIYHEDRKSFSGAELLRRSLDGDIDCLGALLAGYVNYLKVLSQAQLDVRVRRRVSSSDVVQETLLEAHRDFPQFQGQSLPEFTGWLRRILINNLARIVESHLLAAKRDIRREKYLEEVDESLNRSAARLERILADEGGNTPASEVDRQETLVRLADAIASLAPKYREVIILRHIEGESFSEIGSRMERTSGAARMLWMRAIEKLREAMA